MKWAAKGQCGHPAGPPAAASEEPAGQRRRGALTAEELAVWQSARAAAWSRVVLGGVLVIFLIVLGRVAQLKVQPDPRMAEAVGSPMSKAEQLSRRGDLLDRKGRVIATSTLGYRLFVDPMAVRDLGTLSVDLADAIAEDPIAIERTLSEAPLDSRYVVISHLLDPWQVEAVRRLGLRGVGLQERLVRQYPHEELGAALVGTVGFEHTGLSGMELRFNRELRPQPGRYMYLRDARRSPLWIEQAGYQPPADGAAVRLSIDLVIQRIVEERLEAAVEERLASGGRMVVLDCRTGEILAMHDVLVHRSGRTQQPDDPLREIHPALGRNRCVTDPYEPGSTFKPFVWSVATEEGLARLDETLPTPEGPPGYRTSYGRIIRDSHYYGPSTWRFVLVKSMNSGMAIIAERMTHDRMQRMLHDFGFGERTRCGLPGESAGIVTAPRHWSIYTQSSVSMGHEIAVTPIQMVRAFAAFARDGTLPPLRLLAVTEETADESGPIRRVISEETAKLTRAVMRDVMIDGTGRRAQSDLYTMFGKSGTAQLPKKGGGGYFERRYVSSFIAGAPYDEPRIVVLCVIDDPDREKGHWGGAIAGPVVRDVIDATLDYLGVQPDVPKAPDADGEDAPETDTPRHLVSVE